MLNDRGALDLQVLLADWSALSFRYGYARVSTDGQSLAAQVASLKEAGCEKIFQEKISGARSDRKELVRLMAALEKGDVVVVTRLDRLARSTRDLLNLLGMIAERRAEFKSLKDSWADTTTAHGRLMLTLLGGWLSLSVNLLERGLAALFTLDSVSKSWRGDGSGALVSLVAVILTGIGFATSPVLWLATASLFSFSPNAKYPTAIEQKSSVSVAPALSADGCNRSPVGSFAKFV